MKGNSSSSIPWEEKTGQTAFLFPWAAPIAGSLYFSCAHTQTDADAAVAVWCVVCGVRSEGRYFCVSRVASNRVVNSLLIFNRKSHRRRRRKLSRRVRERLESARPPFANYEFYKRPRRHRFLLFIFAPPPPFGLVTSDQKKKKKKNLILCPASSFVHIMSGRLMESQNDSTSFLLLFQPCHLM